MEMEAKDSSYPYYCGTGPETQECEVNPVPQPPLVSFHELVNYSLTLRQDDGPEPSRQSLETCSNPGISLHANPLFSDRSSSSQKTPRKRRKKADPKSWACNQKKELRMRGKKLIKGKDASGNDIGYTAVRTLGQKCDTHRTIKVFECEKASENLRQRLFNTFWNNMDWGQKKVYIKSLCEMKPTAKSKSETETIKNRAFFIKYHLIIEGDVRIRVCRNLFLNTFGLGRKMVEDWCKKCELGAPTAPVARVRKETPPKCPTASLEYAKQFLQELPKQDPHYCQNLSSKTYLEPVFHTFAELFSVYTETCVAVNHGAVSSTTFKTVFDSLNLSLTSTKRDTCFACDLFKANEASVDEYKFHQMKKERARLEKSFDTSMCEKKTYHVITVDLQLVQAPMFNDNCIYLKSKLNVYNYTIYHLGTHDVRCYYWNESEGGLAASVFASLLIDYMESLDDSKPVIIFSDGCEYQNRNACLSNALLNFSMKAGRPVFQKFLEKGHTQTECDTVHNLLERKAKNVYIRLPSDYLGICESSRKKTDSQKSFEAKEIPHDFFKDYACPSIQRYTSIRPGNKAGEPEVQDIRALKYDPSGFIYFKTNFDAEWEKLPQIVSELPVQSQFNRLYESTQKVSERKWMDLQDLKSYLPTDCRDFYRNLPH